MVEGEFFMRYSDIELSNFEFDSSDKNGCFDVTALTFENMSKLISMADAIRKKAGYTDLASQMNNEVYYNFYLYFDAEKMAIRLYFVTNCSEKDDYADYDLPITNKEKEMLLYKIIKTQLKEILEFS